MSKFKVGDRVRCMHLDDFDEESFEVGKIYEVTGISKLVNNVFYVLGKSTTSNEHQMGDWQAELVDPMYEDVPESKSISEYAKLDAINIVKFYASNPLNSRAVDWVEKHGGLNV